MKKRRAGGARRGGGEEEGEGGERRRRGSEDDDDEEESVSSWMADHSRKCHDGVISADPMDDYEFVVTGTFQKPLHRQVDEMLRIDRAECRGVIKIGKEIWKLKLPLLNGKHEYWAPRSMSYNVSNYNR